MSNAIVPFEQQRTLALAFVKSGLFGVRDEAQALSLMALCEAEGLHPAKAVQEFHIIQGKPARKADAVLARFQAAGGSVKWGAYTDAKVSAVFSHPQGGAVEVEWTIEQAKKIGLAGKDNWKNYPRAMLRARCISEGVRTVFPGVTAGIYTVEEMQDMTPAQVQAAGSVEVAPDAPQELLDSANQASLQGLEAYAAFWKALTPAERTAIGSARHNDYKAQAAQTVTA